LEEKNLKAMAHDADRPNVVVVYEGADVVY